MSAARRILLVGGLTLALWGMGHGLWYAVFAEHQALNAIGSSLTAAFTGAAQRNVPRLNSSMQQYKEAKYVYDRQVDAHSHWIGFAMLLIVLAVCFDRLALSEKWKVLLAWGVLSGAVLFPLGVLLQTFSHGPMPRAIAALGSALEIVSLLLIAIAFARRPSPACA